MIVPLNVLVVDDDESARELMAYAVRSFGHRCQTASNGHAALDAMAASAPSVIISDLEMPGIGGIELCRLAHDAVDATSHPYFIVLSGADDDEQRRAVIAAGADEYRLKPVDLDSLEACLAALPRAPASVVRLASP